MVNPSVGGPAFLAVTCMVLAVGSCRPNVDSVDGADASQSPPTRDKTQEAPWQHEDVDPKLFPPRKKEKRIEWRVALKLIQSGDVVFAAQAHSLDVWLQTRQGDRYRTKEPQIDDLLKAVRELAPNDDLQYGTE